MVLHSCGGSHPDAIAGSRRLLPTASPGKRRQERRRQGKRRQLWGTAGIWGRAAPLHRTHHHLMGESPAGARCFSSHPLFNFISTKPLEEGPKSQCPALSPAHRGWDAGYSISCLAQDLEHSSWAGEGRGMGSLGSPDSLSFHAGAIFPRFQAKTSFGRRLGQFWRYNYV